MKNTTDEAEELGRRVKRLFRDTVLENRVNALDALETYPNLAYDELFSHYESLKRQIDLYDLDWEVGDTLMMKDEKTYMIIHCPGKEGNDYHLLDLSNGQTAQSYFAYENIREVPQFRLFTASGEFDPQVVDVIKKRKS